MFKRYYISSKIRFTIFVSIVLLIVFMSISAMFQISYASNKGNDVKSYYAITVESGDTLWSIASEYSDGKTDIRKLIYEITELNKLETAEIAIGQKLLIPA